MGGDFVLDEAARGDPKRAAEILNVAFGTKGSVKVVLDQLAQSIRVVSEIAPNAWAVTLSEDGFRMNVGQTEVLTAFSGKVRLLMEGMGGGSDPSLRHHLSPSPYKSVRGENYIFHGSVPQFLKYRDAILGAHRDYLYEAGTTKSGRPRKGTPHRRSHSPGVVELAQSVPTKLSHK
ncbi:MAG TPA: hypothetical protein VE779_04675 [Candidatus Angelobacter sp.]|nr:hypothetical protein [Candidatus Angelobacter sp.]